MKAPAVASFILLVACADVTGPDLGRLHDAYVLDRVGFETVPAQVKDWGNGFGLRVIGGGVRCPDPNSGSPDQEVYQFVATDPWYTWDVTVLIDVACEADPPNRLRYTYPATGETVVATVWKGVGEAEGDFFQTKRMPSREAFTAAISAMQGLPIYWEVLLLDGPERDATFRSSR